VRTISGGVVSVVGNQTTMRILVLGAPLNTDPIPDGPALHLYLRHPRSGRRDTYPATRLGAQDLSGGNLSPVTGTNGSIQVTLIAPTPPSPDATVTRRDDHADADR
jgi:hypothetical protein